MNKRLLLLAALVLVLPVMTFAGNGGSTSSYRLPAGVKASEIMSRTVVFRVNPAFRSLCTDQEIRSAAFTKVISTLGDVKVEKMFPRHLPPASATNERGEPLVDLSLIYEMHYTASADLVKTINALLRTGLFLYAEPKFIPTTQYNPNDPQTSLQYFLTKINAYAGWDVHKGDTSTVIGITDTGTDMDHPDLASNMKRNWADPIDGVDNDNDGYTDNFTGWDLGEADNNPAVGANDHGSHVSGCADAVTDNGTGVASPGFYCKYMPVKIADGSGALTKAYEGIVYAADAGCQIINCSWGGSGGSTLGQNIIDYATFTKNSLVIAAAGNNNSLQLFYPAAYDNVLSVASTGNSDTKSVFSNFGTYIDVCAPGSGIYSAQWDNSYQQQSGTSMASPVAAGCAAIIKSYFPSYTALQVGEQLRVTCDNIYGLAGNAGYQNQLGKGRINLYNALTQSGPSIRMKNIVVADNNDNILIVGDTMRISGDIINYLAATTNLVVTVTSTSPYISIIDGTTTVGALSTLATSNNGVDPFTIRILPGTPQNTSIPLTFEFNDGAYSDYQPYAVTVNVDYLNITINDVYTTNSSKGRICYNGTSQAEGLGFNYQQNGSLAYETGFMLGISGNVADNVRGASAGVTDEDFNPLFTIQKHEPGIWSDYDTYGSFNDATNGAGALNFTTNYRTMSWGDAPFAKFHIFEYTIHNTGGTTRNNVYGGIFSDWDIQTYANNKIDEDAGLKMGYTYCTDANGLYAGIKLLTSTGGFRHYGVDNITGGGGGVNLFDGYSDSEKYTTLSTNRATAGGTGTGNDVIDIVGTGPFTLAPGDSVVVAFALIAGDELSDLQNSAQQAQIKYDLVTGIQQVDASGITLADAWPNPSTGLVQIPVYMTFSNEVNMEVYDNFGRLISTRSLGRLGAGAHTISVDLSTLATGLYHYRLFNNGGAVSGTIQKN